MKIQDLIQAQTQLNPVLWDKDQLLKPQVRLALLKMAQDFQKYVDIPFEVRDIIVAGSQAGYNYIPGHSDLDLHLIADYDTLGPCDRTADELFDTKRHLYKRIYDIEIHGIPVELYVENLAEPAVSSVYSVLANRWLKPPKRPAADSSLVSGPPDMAAPEIRDQSSKWADMIRRAIDSDSLAAVSAIRAALARYRQGGLREPSGEFSTANLVYKFLRNTGSLDDLIDAINRLHSERLSLK